MIPEQIFWWALALIAVLAAVWVSTITFYAAHALFKQRGKVSKVREVHS